MILIAPAMIAQMHNWIAPAMRATPNILGYLGCSFSGMILLRSFHLLDIVSPFFMHYRTVAIMRFDNATSSGLRSYWEYPQLAYTVD